MQQLRQLTPTEFLVTIRDRVYIGHQPILFCIPWQPKDGQTMINRTVKIAYHLVDNTIVANDWADLVDGTLQNAINLDEFGSPRITQAFTNVTVAGASNGKSCDEWASTLGNTRTGDSGATDSTWTASLLLLCSDTLSLYCFEQ